MTKFKDKCDQEEYSVIQGNPIKWTWLRRPQRCYYWLKFLTRRLNVADFVVSVVVWHSSAVSSATRVFPGLENVQKVLHELLATNTGNWAFTEPNTTLILAGVNDILVVPKCSCKLILICPFRIQLLTIAISSLCVVVYIRWSVCLYALLREVETASQTQVFYYAQLVSVSQVRCWYKWN